MFRRFLKALLEMDQSGLGTPTQDGVLVNHAQQMLQIDVGSFLPRGLAGLDLWLRGDQATVVNAVIADGSNLTTGSWTKVNSTTPDFETILDTNDGGVAKDHYVLQAVASIEIGKTITLTARMKSGTLTECLFAPGGVSAFVDLNTGGTISASPGMTVTSTPAPGGGWDFSFTWVAVNTNIVIATASGGTSPYIGTGTGTILVTNVQLIQHNVSRAIDLSGLGHHCDQAVPGSRPVILTPSDGNGMPAFHYDGGQLLQSANVDWTGLTECTVFLVVKQTAAAAVAIIEKGVPGVSSGVIVDFNSDLFNVATDDGAAVNVQNTGAGTYAANTVPYLVSYIADATLPQNQENALWVQGYSQPLSLGTADNAAIGSNTPYFIGARSGGGFGMTGDLYEVIVYRRKLSAAERRTVELYLARRYNIPTDQHLRHNSFGLVGFWDPHLGLTTVDAQVLDPTDFTTANWTPIGVVPISAHTIREDLSFGIHVVTEGAATISAQPNKPYHVRALIPASSGNGRYVMVYSGNGGDQVFLDTQLGVVAGINGGPTNVTYVNGVLDYDCISAAGPNIYFSTWDGVTAGITWAGNNLRTATCLRIDVFQKNVSSWLSQAGVAGWNVTNAVAATRPTLWATGGWKSGPYLDYQRAAATQLASPATALNQPSTVLIVAATTHVTGGERLTDGTAQNTRGVYNINGTTDNMFAGANLTSAVYAAGAWHKHARAFNGLSGRSQTDTLPYTSGNVGGAAAAGIVFGDWGLPGGAAITMKQSYSALYNRAVSPGEINAEFAWLDSLAA